MKINGTITISCGDKGVEIELDDDDASITFATICLTPQQFIQALGRLYNTPCASMEVHSLDRVGKKMTREVFEFEIPSYEKLGGDREKRMKDTLSILQTVCPQGWIPDTNFSSRGAFFEKDGKYYARTIIRKWIELK